MIKQIYYFFCWGWGGGGGLEEIKDKIGVLFVSLEF